MYVYSYTSRSRREGLMYMALASDEKLTIERPETEAGAACEWFGSGTLQQQPQQQPPEINLWGRLAGKPGRGNSGAI